MAKQDNQFTAEELAAKDEAEKQQAIKDMTVKGKVKAVTPAEEVATVPVTKTDGVQPITWDDAVSQASAAYSPYRPIQDEYVTAEPKEGDYVKDADWFDTYFPTVTKEEEKQRQKKYEQAQRWGLFGNALAAIGNAVGATYGGRPVQIYEPKAPDLQAWKNQLNTDRRARAAAEEQQKARYTTARNTWQTGKASYARALNQWQQQVNGAAKTIYSTDAARVKQQREQEFKNEQADKAFENKMTLQTYLQDRLDRRKQMVGGGTLSHSSGGKRGGTSKDITDADLDAAEEVLNSGKLQWDEQEKLRKASSASTIRNLTRIYKQRYGIGTKTSTGGSSSRTSSTGRSGANGGRSTQQQSSKIGW